MSQENPRSESWARYYKNHPKVIATWGESNGRENICNCQGCDPEQIRPRSDIAVETDQ